MLKRKNERGQALTELVMGLLALCYVMLGVLLIGMLGSHNIRVLSKARTNADTATNASASLQFTQEWKDKDKMFLSGDEERDSGDPSTGSSFMEQLETENYALVSSEDSVLSYPFTNLNLASFFLSAGNLASGKYTESDILKSNNFMTDSSNGLQRNGALSLILKNEDDFTLTGEIVMPVNTWRDSNE